MAARSPSGLVLAADRRVVVVEETGLRVLSVRKLFALGGAAAVATSGAAIGVATSRWLEGQLRGRPALPLEDLAPWIHGVFQARYDDFTRRAEGWFAEHPEAYRLSYILLGGRAADGAFGFRFEASESPGAPYRLLATGSVLTAPRRLGLEARLQGLIRGGASTGELAETIVQGLRLVAQKEPEAVAGPFDLALFDEGGLELRILE